MLPLEKITVARSSRVCLRAAHRSFDPRAGQKPQQQRGDFFAEPRAGRRFFEQDRLARDLQRNTVEQRLGGDHGFQPALRGARGQRFAGDRVIQIHRDFARQHRREIHERAGNRRRQQDADHLLARPCAAQAAGEKDRAEQHAAPFHARAPLVSHGEAEGRAVRGADQAAVQRAHAALVVAYASVCNCCTASRTSKGVAVDGMGLPKLTVTG